MAWHTSRLCNWTKARTPCKRRSVVLDWPDGRTSLIVEADPQSYVHAPVVSSAPIGGVLTVAAGMLSLAGVGLVLHGRRRRIRSTRQVAPPATAGSARRCAHRVERRRGDLVTNPTWLSRGVVYSPWIARLPSSRRRTARASRAGSASPPAADPRLGPPRPLGPPAAASPPVGPVATRPHGSMAARLRCPHRQVEARCRHVRWSSSVRWAARVASLRPTTPWRRVASRSSDPSNGVGAASSRHGDRLAQCVCWQPVDRLTADLRAHLVCRAGPRYGRHVQPAGRRLRGPTHLRPVLAVVPRPAARCRLRAAQSRADRVVPRDLRCPASGASPVRSGRHRHGWRVTWSPQRCWTPGPRRCRSNSVVMFGWPARTGPVVSGTSSSTTAVTGGASGHDRAHRGRRGNEQYEALAVAPGWSGH